MRISHEWERNGSESNSPSVLECAHAKDTSILICIVKIDGIDYVHRHYDCESVDRRYQYVTTRPQTMSNVLGHFALLWYYALILYHSLKNHT